MKKNCKHRAAITREACCENRKKDNQLQRVLETGAVQVHKVKSVHLSYDNEILL